MKNTNNKILTEEIKKELSDRFRAPDFREVLQRIKDANDSGTFEVVVSTQEVDRQGESIDQAGWDLTFYRMNPVVLWAHDYFSMPIGVTDEIEVKDGKLVARGRFAPEEANPFAQQIRKLYDLKIVRATSVGFIPKEAQGNRILKAELLEWSFVPVPANPFALSLNTVKSLGLDLSMLATKGIVINAKDQENDGGSQEKTEKEITTKPEVTDNYIRIPVKNPDDYDPDSIRTITISEEKGIKALTGCPKGEYENGKCNVATEIITYLFDKDKWTEAEAQAWAEEHKSIPYQDLVMPKDATINAAQTLNLEKIGAELAALQSEIDDVIVKHSRSIIEILQGEYQQQSEESKSNKTINAASTKDGQGGVAEESRPKDETPKQRSSNAGSDTEALNQWLQVRQVLRLVNNVTSAALEKINKQTRKK